MPYVTIDIFKRDLKIKRALVKAVTKAVVKTLKSAPERVHVVINEMKRDQHAVGGMLSSDAKKKK
jgi:4-oxalocrotonate tautomerase